MAAVSYKGYRWVPSHKFHNANPGKGEVLFTGPDGTRDYKTKILDARYVGVGRTPRDGTSNLDYVMRAAQGSPYPKSRSRNVGEIGWDVGVREDHVKLWRSGYQIRQGEHRLACDLRHTHLYQTPWYLPPKSYEKVTMVDLKNSKKYAVISKKQSRMSTSSSSSTCPKRYHFPSVMVAY